MNEKLNRSIIETFYKEKAFEPENGIERISQEDDNARILLIIFKKLLEIIGSKFIKEIDFKNSEKKGECKITIKYQIW